MSDTKDDDSSTGPGAGPGGSGTRRADVPDIPSGFAGGSSGTVRAGADIGSGFGARQSGTGTTHATGPDIGSGFGPTGGSLGTQLNPGDPLVINGVTYRYERVLSKSTGEAEIFLLRQDKQLVVFKLYYQSFKPKQEILAPLKQLRHADIINIIDYGYFYDRFFEIMEYAQGGTLEQYLPIRDLQRLRAIVSETVNAFKFCHDRGIVHRDIKPENIYCRNADGTDFVIGDFGISSALDAGVTRQLTSQNLTAGYAAPEMYGYGGKVIVGREVDYYALGITLIHLWQGKSPFDGLTIHYIANLTSTGAINVPNELPDALQTLIRGLITIDFAKRWGHDEVQRWLNGEDVPVHFQVKEITYPAFQFDTSGKASTPVALAGLLKASPDRGKKLLYSGKISAWLNLFDPMLTAELDLIVEDEYPKNQDAGLQKAIYLLDPDEPFTQVNRECRTPNELATELDGQFDFYLSQLTNPNYSIYLYLEAHEAKKEADAFRAYFRTFSAKKALNTVILELAGRESVTIHGAVFNTPEAVLQARNRPDVVNMLKDRESKLSLWMEGAASKSVNAQLDAWRALKISDETTLAFVGDKGDGVPQLALSKNTFSFTDLKTRTTVSDSFEIQNTGGGVLTGSITSNKKWLQLVKTQIDGSRKTQTMGFSVDTAGLPFGATDSATVEVQSNVGTETVSIAIAIEQGTRAAARFRTYMTLGGGALGAMLGFAIHKMSALAGTSDPSGLAGIVGVVGVAIVAAMTAKRNGGKAPLLFGIATLVLGLLAIGYASASLPAIFSALSWGLLFLAIAPPIAPSILKLTQVSRNKVAVPIGILVGTAALSSAMVLGDRQFDGIQDRYLAALRGISQPTPTTPVATTSGNRLSIFGLETIRIGMSMAEVERASGLTFRGAAEQSGQSCYSVEYPTRTGSISLLIKNGRVAVVSIYGTEYATLSGVRPGDSQSKVRATYPAGLSELTSGEVEWPIALIFVPKNPSEDQYRMVFTFMLDQTGRTNSVVSGIHAAKLPDGQYLLRDSAGDGCSDQIGSARQLVAKTSSQLRDANMLGEPFVLSLNLKYGASTSYDPSVALQS